METVEESADHSGDFWFKVDRRIFESSRWDALESAGKVVLLYLIAKAQDPLNPTPGQIMQADSVIARMVGVKAAEVTRAIDALCEPERNSRTAANEGRTVERITGGVRLINFKLFHPAMIENALARKAVRSERARKAAEARWGRRGEDHHPPEQRAENATNQSIDLYQHKLGTLLCELSEHENSRLMVPQWCRKVSSYEKADGTKVKGRSDYRTIRSIERLEHCIEDAEWWLKEMSGGRVVT